MRRCPDCQTRMKAFRAEGHTLDTCPRCYGIWFDGGELTRIVRPAVIERLVAEAKAQPALCRSCAATFKGQERCPNCDRPATRCPRCEEAPMQVAMVEGGVWLDVCPRCMGIWLEAGELRQVSGDRSREVQEAASAAHAAAPVEGMACCACARRLVEEHAFERGHDLYCGSCAPEGAAPRIARLTPKETELYGRSVTTSPLANSLIDCALMIVGALTRR